MAKFDKSIEQIILYCKTLNTEKLLSKGDCVSIRIDDTMLITTSGINLADIKPTDIITVALNADIVGEQKIHQSIYNARPETSAIINNHAPNCVTVAKVGIKIPAVLDDMAQIIGPSAKVAKSDSIADILSTLKGRNACLVRNAGVIATGRTLDEAYTGTLVLEKGAKTFIESNVLGGTKPINIIEAALMHFIYKKKYSKADQNAKAKDNK